MDMNKKAIFLDRDGTLNEDPGYLSRPEQMTLLPGAGEGLARLKQAGFVLVVVSNQSGVGRGLIPSGALVQIHQRLQDLLRSFDVTIDQSLCRPTTIKKQAYSFIDREILSMTSGIGSY
jgi:histidinol-phosphate phosphatase family protein